MRVLIKGKMNLVSIHKVHCYLTQKVTLPAEQEAKNKGESLGKFKTYDGNVKAYDLLVRSFTGIPLSLIKSVDSGNACKMWEKLLSKYKMEKENTQSLEEEWNSCKLEGLLTDPVGWFLKLDRINRLLELLDLKYKKDDVQLAEPMLNNVGKEYSGVVTSIEASGKTKGIDAIKDVIERHWKKNKTSGGSKGLLGEGY